MARARPQEKIQANGQLDGALSRLLVVVENYPQLKSNENFLRLQDELAGTENRIAVERRKYNETVQRYNTDIELFPNNIAASMFGFQRNDAYFKTEPGARNAPKVVFLSRLSGTPRALLGRFSRAPTSFACYVLCSAVASPPATRPKTRLRISSANGDPVIRKPGDRCQRQSAAPV